MGTGPIQEVLNCSVHVLNGEVPVTTSTAREKLLTRALTWSFKMTAGISTMPLLLQIPCDKSKPFTAGLAVIIMLFPALSETCFVFLGFRPLYQGRFLYPPLAIAPCIREKLSLKCSNCMRKKNVIKMLGVSIDDLLFEFINLVGVGVDCSWWGMNKIPQETFQGNDHFQPHISGLPQNCRWHFTNDDCDDKNRWALIRIKITRKQKSCFPGDKILFS